MRDPRRNPLRSDNAAHRPAFQRHVSVWIEVLLFDGDNLHARRYSGAAHAMISERGPQPASSALVTTMESPDDIY
jgi:hypothetical protein